MITQCIKIAIGSGLAIAIADYLGLSSYTSAGIIALLSIRATKRETIVITLRRLFAFSIATALSLLIFTTLGSNTLAFVIFLFIYVYICSKLDLIDAISMNCVLVTHYLLADSITKALVYNETLLLITGLFIGTAVNMYMPDDTHKIKCSQNLIEDDIRIILRHMAYNLRTTDNNIYNDSHLNSLYAHINAGIEYAYSNMNNSLIRDSGYYLQYMKMRSEQANILNNIYEIIRQLPSITPQSIEIADYIDRISDTLSETNNAINLLTINHQLYQSYKTSSLPVERAEFETRASLYIVLRYLENFLNIKKNFAASLTEYQMKTYWNHS